MDIQVDSNIKEVEDLLYKAGAGLREMKKKVLSTLARGTKSSIQGNIYTKLNKRTGKSRSKVISVVKKDFAYVIMRPYGIYKLLEYGGKILAKKKHLIFKIEDKWIRTKEVNIKPHDFFNSGADKYFGSKSDGDLEKLLKKEIERLWKT